MSAILKNHPEAVILLLMQSAVFKVELKLNTNTISLAKIILDSTQ